MALAGSGCGEQFSGDVADRDASSAGGSAGSAGSSKATGGGSSDAATRGAGGTGNSGASGGSAGSSGTGTGGGSGGMKGGGTGGVAGGTSGGGGSSGSGGLAGAGTAGMGGAPSCTPGTLECDAQPPRRCGVDGNWQTAPCGPLRAADVTNIDINGMPGINVGFRCKSFMVCSPDQDCIYYGQNLGVMQSNEMTFYDGSELAQPEPVRVRIAAGAASQCMDPVITLNAGEKVLVAHDGHAHTIYFPQVSTRGVTLYVREDGATAFDAALTSIAQRPP